MVISGSVNHSSRPDLRHCMKSSASLQFGRRVAASFAFLPQVGPAGCLARRSVTGPVAYQLSASVEALKRSGNDGNTAQTSALGAQEKIVKSLLAGLHYEVSKGLSNTQGTAERFADFAARRSNELLSCGGPSTFTKYAAGFRDYEHLPLPQRHALVMDAIREAQALQATRLSHAVHAPYGMLSRMTPPSPDSQLSNGQATTASAASTARSGSQKSAHGAAEASTSQPRDTSHRPRRQRGASNLKNLVSGDGPSAATGNPQSPGTSEGLRRGGSSQQLVSLTSQRYSGIRLMTADPSAANSAPLTEADLTAALVDSCQPGTIVPSQSSAAPSEDPQTSSGRLEQGQRIEAAVEDGAVGGALVGEDEEFSVGSGGQTGGQSAQAEGAEVLEPAATVQPQGRRQVKPETAAFRASFAQAAAAAAIAEMESSQQVDLAEGEQRTAEWHAERDKRLTASAFGNALGFWPEGRVALWEEKLALRPGFQGNEATAWGTERESSALERYQQLTGHAVSACRFSVLRDDAVHGWLGASPDGLIDSLAVMPGAGPQGVMAGSGPGVLEIKCPFNRGRPTAAAPPQQPPWYYMPQVQGLMEIFDREWCNIYLWTVNGSALFYIPRDRAYWATCFEVLSEFWWAHLVPAKHALVSNKRDLAETYRPQPTHRLTQQLVEYSKQMASSAVAIRFAAAPPKQPVRRMAPMHQKQQ